MTTDDAAIGRWNPFTLPWYVVVNDLVGGWAVSHIDKPLSEQDYRQGEGDLFDSLTKELAEYIVDLHNRKIYSNKYSQGIWWTDEIK